MISSELVACQQQGLGVSTKWGQVEAPIPEADLQLSWILSVNKISRSLGNPKRVTEVMLRKPVLSRETLLASFIASLGESCSWGR